ncbi:GNAT family N-acetyltransferase [Microbacterium sp. NPDC058269]|uniref:GNAT family N-acetyltransferase n=1 Tax=Microbacterium sp. NPDC058269 TaxID=3346414 RepID=UPI0036DF589C
MRIQITDVDPQNIDLLLRWNGILRDGYAVGRQKVWSRSDEATRLQFQNPHPTRSSVLLLAEVDGVEVGAAEAHVHPGEPADVEVAVADAFRRRGVARALLQAVRNALRSTATVMRTETYSDAGVSFARSEGMRVGVRESRQVVDLPLPPGTLDGLPGAPSGVEVISWVGACPEELLDGWARLRAHMSDDVPMGDLTRTATPADITAVRRNEERMSEQGYALVRSVARVDGEPVGYTEILLSRPDPTIVLQDDTFVEERVRGHGIGRALKIANLRRLTSVPESSGSLFLQTYTALTNAPMLALNRSVGFDEVDVLTILEGPLG